MKAADLLDDDEFLGACAAWERDGRAFLGFADLFYERGMVGQAKAWEWAAKEGERKCLRSLYLDRRKSGGVFPTGRGPFYFHRFESRIPLRSDLPNGLFDREFQGSTELPEASACCVADTIAKTIADFLDRWAEVFGESHEPVLTEATNVG